MDRLTLERRQVWVYLAAIIAGLLVGSAWPNVNPAFEALLWPALVLLLYATFVQVPLLHLREAFRDPSVRCRGTDRKLHRRASADLGLGAMAAR